MERVPDESEIFGKASAGQDGRLGATWNKRKGAATKPGRKTQGVETWGVSVSISGCSSKILNKKRKKGYP